MTSTMSQPVAGPDTELHVALDMAKFALVGGPVLVAVCALIWGQSGAWSALFAVTLAVVNLFAGALLITFGARISPAAVMVAALLGFAMRMALVLLAVLLVINQSWVEPLALSMSLLLTHFGLLAWEATRVSASLAFPGLKPTPTRK
jgi:hypothetical protein